MMLGFFYLADYVKSFLVGIFLQIATFIAVRWRLGGFPELLPITSLANANLLSIGAALAYMTLLSLYYEAVMRLNADLELETGEQRNRLSDAAHGHEHRAERKHAQVDLPRQDEP